MNWLRQIWRAWSNRLDVWRYRMFRRVVPSIRMALSAEDTTLVGILHAEYKWRKTRKLHLERDKVCNACGTDKDLEVHHVRPWHLFPDSRYDHANLITLCRCCHFRYGHGLNFKNWNPQIRELCVAVKPYLSDIKTGAEYEE